MNLQSLLVCSDDRTVRVLRQVLDELEIGVEHCAHPTPAQKKLARQTFEAVIVDCTGEPSLSLLKNIRKGQHNKKSVAVAIIDQETALRRAFEMGAHFVIYKPISCERAKSSFRAAKALMKRERRRSLRVQVRTPVSLRFQNGEGEEAFISGLSEGGISVEFSLPCRNSGVVGLCFTLPGATTQIEATGLIAWHNFDGHARAGIRFTKLSDSARVSLKEWLHMKSGEKADPPIRCTITDISSGGCFLRTDSPFPLETRVELFLCVTDCRVRTEGKIRVMHPEFGMGVEFSSKTQEHRILMEEIIARLTLTEDLVPEVLVEPEGLDWGNDVEALSGDSSVPGEMEVLEDPLLELFRTGILLPKEQFLVELEKQRRRSPERCTAN